MVTPKSCFCVQLHLSCNTCSCFAVAFPIRCTLRIRNVDVESSSLIHLLPLIGSLFSSFLLLFVFCIACLLRTQLVLYDDSQYYRIAILNGKHSLFPPTHSPSLSLPSCLFFMQNAKNYFHFPWNWFYKQQKPARKTFCRCPSEKCNSTPDRPRPPPPPP